LARVLPTRRRPQARREPFAAGVGPSLNRRRGDCASPRTHLCARAAPGQGVEFGGALDLPLPPHFASGIERSRREVAWSSVRRGAETRAGGVLPASDAG